MCKYGGILTFARLAALAILAGPGNLQGAEPPAPAPATISLDDFEAEPKGWKFVGGEEFPGAKGALTRDNSHARGGKGASKLVADFQGGGAYVGCWKDLEPLALPDVQAFRVWVEAKNVQRVGVRILDATGQCHQATMNLPKGSGEGFRELVLKVHEIVGGEHWGGANDGKWHGPPTGFGINIGKDALGPDPKREATLWLDDLSALGITPGVSALRHVQIAPHACRPGYGTRIKYIWDAQPLGSDCNVFVHVVNAKGEMVSQADHEPPVPTSRWSGKVEYARSFVLPTDFPEGRYDIVVGLWNPRPADQGGGRIPFIIGSSITPLPDHAAKVGALVVSADAPLPVLAPRTLNLDAYKLTFSEDFDKPLSISAWGPGTRWIAHTPYGGDFGDAGFGNPENDSPFKVDKGLLQIEAKKIGDKWRSGLICSVDPKGEGFSQKFGYFEMRAKLPKGVGTWPAFWLMGVPQLVEPKDKKTIPQIEIDVVEQYGVGPNALHTTLHLWGPGKFHWAEGDTAIVNGMTDDFHTYGVNVDDDFTTFYFDGSEIRKDTTPKDAKVPLYLMVDLALGGGWPIDKTPNPSVMVVDYVRVYARK